MKNGRNHKLETKGYMRSFRKITSLIVAIIAFSLVSVSAQSYSRGARQTPKTMEQQIFKKLNGMLHYGVFDHIAFEVNGGTVTLTGKVISLGAKSEATRTVRDIPGVASVVNNIEELPPSRSDDDIRRQLVRTLANTGGVSRYLQGPRPSVRLVVDRGHVTLEGYVANRGDYNTMNILANGVSGVFSVQNNLIVDNDPSD